MVETTNSHIPILSGQRNWKLPVNFAIVSKSSASNAIRNGSLYSGLTSTAAGGLYARGRGAAMPATAGAGLAVVVRNPRQRRRNPPASLVWRRRDQFWFVVNDDPLQS